MCHRGGPVSGMGRMDVRMGGHHDPGPGGRRRLPLHTLIHALRGFVVLIAVRLAVICTVDSHWFLVDMTEFLTLKETN